ncbi:MAG TPA: hypothetical protein VGD26_04045 [Chitinophagaceae bacterium]
MKYYLVTKWDEDYGDLDDKDWGALKFIGKVVKTDKESHNNILITLLDGEEDWWYWRKNCLQEITEEQANNETMRNFWYELYRLC